MWQSLALAPLDLDTNMGTKPGDLFIGMEGRVSHRLQLLALVFVILYPRVSYHYDHHILWPTLTSTEPTCPSHMHDLGTQS